ncbi:uncharacterized protein LOC106667386 isoform X1 [Cimex lectularius]|uniref:THAP-type domain-containing protein n=1 Tax=Cimex lectularius TaxID=79782 RepID=A0A8I6RSW1_CIMLE|nr:uncharacterized protein LOC106667386 isoform X1 [Cimex lectularius]
MNCQPNSVNKRCFVNLCTCTSQSRPEKVFFAVPTKESERQEWFDSVGQCFTKKTNQKLYCCSDHFDMKDMVISMKRDSNDVLIKLNSTARPKVQFPTINKSQTVGKDTSKTYVRVKASSFGADVTNKMECYMEVNNVGQNAGVTMSGPINLFSHENNVDNQHDSPEKVKNLSPSANTSTDKELQAKIIDLIKEFNLLRQEVTKLTESVNETLDPADFMVVYGTIIKQLYKFNKLLPDVKRFLSYTGKGTTVLKFVEDDLINMQLNISQLILKEYKQSVNKKPSLQCYKHCFVYKCKNNCQRSPLQIFLTVPKNKNTREKWFKASGTPMNEDHLSELLFCCDRHFTDKELEILCMKPSENHDVVPKPYSSALPIQKTFNFEEDAIFKDSCNKIKNICNKLRLKRYSHMHSLRKLKIGIIKKSEMIESEYKSLLSTINKHRSHFKSLQESIEKHLIINDEEEKVKADFEYTYFKIEDLLLQLYKSNDSKINSKPIQLSDCDDESSNDEIGKREFLSSSDSDVEFIPGGDEMCQMNPDCILLTGSDLETSDSEDVNQQNPDSILISDTDVEVLSDDEIISTNSTPVQISNSDIPTKSKNKNATTCKNIKSSNCDEIMQNVKSQHGSEYLQDSSNSPESVPSVQFKESDNKVDKKKKSKPFEIRSCFVPTCSNNDFTMPHKKYILVPKGKLRIKWFNSVGLNGVTTACKVYCCEDHFTVEELQKLYQKEDITYCKNIIPNRDLRTEILSNRPSISSLQNCKTPRVKEKVCFVPSCINTSSYIPKMHFFNVPQDSNTRDMWYNSVGYVAEENDCFNQYCCADHFRNEDIMKAPGRIWLKPDACPVIVNNDTLLLPSSDSDDYVVIKEEEPEDDFSAPLLSDVELKVEEDYEEVKFKIKTEDSSDSSLFSKDGNNYEAMANCEEFLEKVEESWDKFQIVQEKIINLVNEDNKEVKIKKLTNKSYGDMKEVLNEILTQHNSDDSILKMYRELSLLKDKIDESKVPKNVTDFLLKKAPNEEKKGQSLEDNALLQYVNIKDVKKLSSMIEKMDTIKKNIEKEYEVIEEQLSKLTSLGETRKTIINKANKLLKEGNMQKGIQLLKSELTLLREKKAKEIVKLISESVEMREVSQKRWDDWIEKYWIMFNAMEDNLSNLLKKINKKNRLEKSIRTEYKKLEKKLDEIPSTDDQIKPTCDNAMGKKRIRTSAPEIDEPEQNISGESFKRSENIEEKLPFKKLKSNVFLPEKSIGIVNKACSTNDDKTEVVKKADEMLFIQPKIMTSKLEMDLYNDDEITEGYEEPELLLNQPSGDCVLTINEFETYSLNKGNSES